METEFKFKPSEFIPWKINKKVFDKVRNIKREEITKHLNPDFKIRILKDDEMSFAYIIDIFYRIKQASDENKRLILILGNPDHNYKKVALLINKFKVSCKKLYIFNMDEFADENGNIAPESYPQSFMRAMKNYFYKNIDEKLRPSENQIIGPNNQNIKDYGKIIADFGGANAIYSGPGWTGHLAFIEPAVKGCEFECNLDDWKKMGPRIVRLNLLTIAQNSMHGSFGMSGDITNVPPKAATIGPAEIINAKHRSDWNDISIGGTNISWQRFVTRLIAHGPVTPLVPTSILQTLKTDFYISETLAKNIEPDWEKGY